MIPKLEETIYLDFITTHPTTGAAADADSTPTVEVFENATDTPIVTPTPVKRTSKTGDYRVAIDCTAANGFEVGKSYSAVAAATVNAVAGKAVIGSFQVRANTPDDVYTRIGAPAGASMSADVAAVKADTGRAILRAGTAAAGAASTITLDASAPTTVDLYKGCGIAIVSGTGAGQGGRFINAYSSGRVAQVDRPWVVTPDNTSVFVIFAAGGDSVRPVWRGYAAGGGAGSSITLPDGVITFDDKFAGMIATVVSGTGAGQSGKIMASGASTDVLSLDEPIQGALDGTSLVEISTAVLRDLDSRASVMQAKMTDIINALANNTLTLASTSGVAVSGGVATIVLAVGSSGLDDFYNGWLATIADTNGNSFIGFVSDYVGATRTAHIVRSSWEAAFSGTIIYGLAQKTFVAFAFNQDGGDIPTAGEVEDAVWDALEADHVGANTTGAALTTAKSNSTTMLARLGAWTGSGVNTLLGALRALMNKGAGVATPTDISGGGGGFNNTTDSAEALRDRGDAAWTTGSGGSGGTVGPGAIAYTVTITEDDDVTPIGDVDVWVTTDEEGDNVIAGTLRTDAFGHATFMLDAGDYFLWQQKTGVNFTNPGEFTVEEE